MLNNESFTLMLVTLGPQF